MRAVDGVDLVVERGDYVAIMGASGSGKSTLMNIIGCLDVADRRAVPPRRHRRPPARRGSSSLVRNRKIGFVFQSFNLSRARPRWRNVELPLAYAASQPRSGGERARRRARRGRPRRPGATTAQRALRRPAAAGRRGARDRDAPALVLADEPTGALDSHSTARRCWRCSTGSTPRPHHRRDHPRGGGRAARQAGGPAARRPIVDDQRSRRGVRPRDRAATCRSRHRGLARRARCADGVPATPRRGVGRRRAVRSALARCSACCVGVRGRDHAPVGAVGRGSARGRQLRRGRSGSGASPLSDRSAARGGRSRAAAARAAAAARSTTARRPATRRSRSRRAGAADPSAGARRRSRSRRWSTAAVTATYGAPRTPSAQVIGTTRATWRTDNDQVAGGAPLHRRRLTTRSRAALVGPTVAERPLRRRRHRVVGKTVQSTASTSPWSACSTRRAAPASQDQDDLVIAPLTAVQDTLTGYGSCSSIS